jgi:hypothetical protein
MGLFEQPYNAALCLVLGTVVLLGRRRGGAGPGSVALAAGLCLLAAAVPLTWLLILTRLDPGMASWSAHNVLESPPPHAYLAAFAPLWLLAGAGLRLAWRELGPRRWLLVAWVVAPVVLVYLPVSFQRRMAEGWIVPLGILAAVAAARLRLPLLGSRASAALLVTVSCLGSAYLVSVDLLSYREGSARHYSPTVMMEGLRELGARAELDDVVVASWVFSAWAPAHAPVRVLHGHRIQGIPTPEVVDAVMSGLAQGARSGSPPRFGAPLAHVRFLVFEGAPPGARVLALGDNRIPAWWGPPAFHNAGLDIYDLATPAQ